MLKRHNPSSKVWSNSFSFARGSIARCHWRARFICGGGCFFFWGGKENAWTKNLAGRFSWGNMSVFLERPWDLFGIYFVQWPEMFKRIRISPNDLYKNFERLLDLVQPLRKKNGGTISLSSIIVGSNMSMLSGVPVFLLDGGCISEVWRGQFRAFRTYGILPCLTCGLVVEGTLSNPSITLMGLGCLEAPKVSFCDVSKAGGQGSSFWGSFDTCIFSYTP